MKSLIILLTVTSLFSATIAQTGLFGQTYTGDGTFYGVSKTGHCSFGFSNSYNLPWADGTAVSVAINGPEYADSSPCGMCVALEGTGAGSGLTPIPATVQYAIVADSCGECIRSDLDLAEAGDGRWKISWTPVQCAVGNTFFQYSFAGSNPYYIKLQISNTRVPVAAVQLLTGGSYVSLQRTVDNYFQLFSGLPVGFPTQVKVTSIFGDTVQDTINVQSVTGPPVTGTAQFPLNPAYSTVGSPVSGTSNSTSTSSTPSTSPPSRPTQAPPLSSSSTPPPTTLPSLNTPPTTTSATPSTSPTTPSSTPSAALKAYDQCGGSGGSCSSHTCVDATWSDASCPAGYTCNRVSQYYHQCQPSTSAAVEGLPAGCNRTSLVYESCGGEGDRCAETGQCYDAPWEGNCCVTPGTTCQRLQKYYWQCLYNTTNAQSDISQTSSASPISTPPTAPSPSPTASSTPISDIIEPLPPTDSSCRLSISPNQICGGIGGTCSSLGVCADAPAPGACCSSGYVCERENEYVYTCARNATAAIPGVLTIADNLQCGGLTVPNITSVSDLEPVDGPWVGAQCLNGFVCQRYDAHYYACSGFPFVPPAAFNLTGLNESGANIEGENTGTPLNEAVALANAMA